MIVAEGLARTFRVRDRRRGLLGALRDLAGTGEREAVAVAGVDFRVEAGEAVALIGPNGAGKSTTVKMLTGILRPTAGRVRVGGLDPWADRQRHVHRIGVVFGQRTQLWWDLAVVEALDLLAAMFDVPPAVAKERVERFDALLGIGPLLHVPVRQLSLGERMRCELAAALLHAPPVLFLDEPTIGLDVAVKLRLRAFLAGLRDAGETTILLTTHDLDDVAALCPRVLLLARGRLLHDGSMDALVARLGGQRSLVLHRRDGTTERRPFEGPDQVREALTADVADLRVEEPSVDELVARYYDEDSPLPPGERGGG
ncbi:MAG: ABC transporter ATP-binding protein [Myxococcota bacterium]